MVIIFFAFPFPELDSVQTIKLVSSLHLPFYFLFYHFFLEHLNNTFETTLSCALVVEWNYYVDYQTTQTWSRTTATYKMELFRTIFWQFPFFNKFNKDLQLRCCKHLLSDSHYRHFHFAGLDQSWIRVWSQFCLYIEIDQSILMAKKMAGCYEIGI